MLNKIYKSVSTEELVTVIEFNEKTKTVMVEFPDGRTKSYSSTTIKDKRRFIPVELESPEVVEPLMDLDNPVTEEEAEELGMIGGDEALEQAVVDPEDKPSKKRSNKEKTSGGTSRILITYNGFSKSPSEWGEELGLSPKYIRSQLRKGKKPEEIFKEKN